MKKPIFFLLFVILLSSVAFASDLVYKNGENIDLKIPCFNSGVVCSDLAVCNITVNNPSGNNVINNQEMTNNGVFHNYTVSNTDELGYYQTIVFCIDGADSDYTSFSFKVTENGFLQDDLTFIVALAIVILFCILIAINLKEYDNFFTWLKIILLFFAGIYTFLIASFFIIKTTKTIFYAIFVGQIWVISIFFSVWLIYWLLKKFEVF